MGIEENVQLLEVQAYEANKIVGDIDKQITLKTRRLKRLKLMIRRISDNYKTIKGPDTTVISLGEFRKIKEELARASVELDKSLNELQKTIKAHTQALEIAKQLELQIKSLKGPPNDSRRLNSR